MKSPAIVRWGECESWSGSESSVAGAGASGLTVRASSGCRCISSAWLGISTERVRSLALLFRSFRLRRASKLIPLMSSLAVCVAMSTSEGLGSGGESGGGDASCLAGSSLARYTRTDSTSGSANLICLGGGGSLSGESREIVIHSPGGWIEPGT